MKNNNVGNFTLINDPKVLDAGTVLRNVINVAR